MLTLLWWILAGAAAIQAGRAWGAGAGLGTGLGLFLLSWIPLIGGIGSVVAALMIGVRAENTITPQIDVRS